MCGQHARMSITTVVALAGVVASALAKDEVWRQDTAAAFNKAKKQGVVVTDQGTVRLARAVERAGDVAVERVWDLAIANDGSLYAATGDQGTLWKRDHKGDWRAIYKSPETQLLSVVVAADRVYVGAGPSGVVTALDAEGKELRSWTLGNGVKYVWDLALKGDGTLYAATGPNGQLWRKPVNVDEWSCVYDSAQPHLLCLAIDGEGSVYSGSDGAGLVYKLDAAGKVSVVFDAQQDEVRALRIGPDGALYVGTAVPAQQTGAARASRDRAESGQEPHVIRVGFRQEPARGKLAEFGTAILRAAAPGENSVYRIDAKGDVREVFRARALVFAIAWQGDRMLIGTGPDGQIFEVRGRESSPIARLDHGQILALAVDSKTQRCWVASGDPGGVYALEPHYVESGTLTSDVLDTRLQSRFGSLQSRSEVPDGTSLEFSVRSGQLAEPDATWSDWSPPVESGDAPAVPNGRYVQYRATFRRDGDVDETPTLRSVSLAYRTRNLPPEISGVTIPDVAAGDGATSRARLELKWDASDPNGDGLEYRLFVRKDPWPRWLPIGGEMALTSKQYDWDATTLPSGIYRLKLVANDRADNPADDALETAWESERFVVDHLAPIIAIESRDSIVRAKIEDNLTRIVKSEVSIDGGVWTPLFASDGIFDTKMETVEIDLSDRSKGPHVVVVRAVDAAGNVGSADSVAVILDDADRDAR